MAPSVQVGDGSGNFPELDMTHYSETLSKITDPADKIDWLCNKLYKNELADRQRMLTWGAEKQKLDERIKVLEEEEADEEAKKAERKRQRKIWLGIIGTAMLTVLPQIYSSIEGLFKAEEKTIEQNVEERVEERLRSLLGSEYVPPPEVQTKQ